MYQVLDRLNSFYKLTYHHISFLQMVYLNDRFDKDHYELKYLRRKILQLIVVFVKRVIQIDHLQEADVVIREFVKTVEAVQDLVHETGLVVVKDHYELKYLRRQFLGEDTST